MNKGIILNSTLADLRGRVDTLAKSVFLIAGGAVTLSINAYLQHKELFFGVIVNLKRSWVLLLISILMFAVVIGLLILQGYISSEFYRKKIEKKESIKDHPKRCLDHFSLFLGVLGFIFFLAGMSNLVLAAIRL